MKISQILLILLIASFSSVQAQEDYISISKGGGVTGSATVHKFLFSGDVLKGQGIGDIRFTEKSFLKRRTRKKFFTRAEKSILESSTHPGNMYYSIMYSHNGKLTTVTWGAEGYTPKEEVKKLYEDLSAKIQVLTFSALK
jgi:hypothetical protein